MSASASIAALAKQAGAAAQAGRWRDAEALWRQVRDLDPTHAEALYSLGVHAAQRGDLAEARALIAEAAKLAPANPVFPLTLARLSRDTGEAGDEWRAIEASLTADPYFLPGLLAKGEFLARQGRRRAAATVYRNALVVAPPEPRWPEALRPALAAAKALVDAHSEELSAALERAVAPVRGALPLADRARWAEAASIISGRTKPYHAVSNQLHVPRLPAITFFDRSHFPWAEALEARTDAIRAEFLAAWSGLRDAFDPYIAYKPGDPVNQWRELNHSERWSVYQLYRNGQPVPDHLQACPTTAEALASVEMAEIDGLCPNAMFSVLAPHTEIPPHHGETNARLVVHLPLVVPANCTYRVGFDQTVWTEGKILAFDDTIEHTARNDSDEWRAVLIFDVWNPLLSSEEREIVRALAAAVRKFHQDDA